MKRRGNVVSPVDSINTLVEQLQQTDFTVEDGETVWVRSEQTLFVYRINSGLVADGVNVVASLYGNGVWQRLNVAAFGNSIPTFNSVIQGNAGSGRLVDSDPAGFKPGQIVWVNTFKDYFRWDPASTLTSNNVTIVNPVLNGVNPGRFIRMLIPAPEWMAQLNWFIDSFANIATVPVENSGADAAHPISSDAERQRRMGPNPLWNGGIPDHTAGTAPYHIRYLNDLDPSDPVILAGTRPSFATIFLHGSLVDGQGQSTLYTVAGDAVVTALNRATNQPWQIASAGLPVSWTASGLVGKRIRRTNGTAAKGWVMKDLAAKTARISQGLTSVPFTVPYSPSTTDWVPANGDTFVVEKLTQIPSFACTISANDAFTVNTTGYSIIVDSLDIGGSAFSVETATRDNAFLVFDGCQVGCDAYDGSGNNLYSDCKIQTFGTPGGSFSSFVAGYAAVSMLIGASAAGKGYLFSHDFATQGVTFTVQSCTVQFGNFAVFDSPGSALILSHPTDAVFGGGVSFWGSGNALYSIDIPSATTVLRFTAASTLFPITSVTGDIRVCSVTTVRPFDNTAGAYAAAVATTFANLVAATPGGFGNHLLSPVFGSGVVANQ
jgi:hypothetical protein